MRCGAGWMWLEGRPASLQGGCSTCGSPVRSWSGRGDQSVGVGGLQVWSNRLSHWGCQGEATGRCRVIRRADDAIRAATLMSLRRMVPVVALTRSGPVRGGGAGDVELLAAELDIDQGGKRWRTEDVDYHERSLSRPASLGVHKYHDMLFAHAYRPHVDGGVRNRAAIPGCGFGY